MYLTADYCLHLDTIPSSALEAASERALIHTLKFKFSLNFTPE